MHWVHRKYSKLKLFVYISCSDNRHSVHIIDTIPVTDSYSHLSAQKYTINSYLGRSGNSSGMSFYLICHTIPSIVRQLRSDRRHRSLNDSRDCSHFDRTVLQEEEGVRWDIRCRVEWFGDRSDASLSNVLHKASASSSNYTHAMHSFICIPGRRAGASDSKRLLW